MRNYPLTIVQILIAALLAWLVNVSLNIGTRVSVLETKIEMVEKEVEKHDSKMLKQQNENRIGT